MLRRFGHLIAFTAIVLGSVALADDEVLLKTKTGKSKGNIVAESTQGVVFKSGAKFAAEDIDDIFYDWPLAADGLAGITYKGGFASERTWLAASDPKKRADAFKSTIDSYEKTIAKAPSKFLKVHLDFKIAYLRCQKALEDNADTKKPMAALRDFVAKNPGGWQITRALTLLAKLQTDAKDFSGAEQSFTELIKLDVSDDVKNEARLQVALMNIHLNKLSVAEAKLNELLKSLSRGTKTYAHAFVAQAQYLMAAKKPAEALEALKQATKESDDKAIKAIAYNTLGTHLYDADQLKEARWEFLWVDVVYNQDKNEHARALYYLSHIFDKLADPDKAAQCRATLLDPAFGGTEYQRKLQKEQTK